MKFIAAALGVLLASAAAYGQGSFFPKGFFYEEPRFYIGGAFGTGNSPDSDREWAGREDAFGGRISGGWEPSRFFAIEGGFGYWRVDENAIPRLLFYEEPQTKNLTSLQLGAIGKVAIDERFSVFGKFGVHNWRLDSGDEFAERSFTSSNPASPGAPIFVARVVEKDDGTDLFYGIGLEMNTRSHAWRFGISATRYENPYRVRYHVDNPAIGEFQVVYREGSHTNIFELSVKRVF